MLSAQGAEVWVRRYRDTVERDVVVVVREQMMVLRCRDYSQAVKWTKIECKSYKIPDDFTVELVTIPGTRPSMRNRVTVRPNSA